MQLHDSSTAGFCHTSNLDPPLPANQISVSWIEDYGVQGAEAPADFIADPFRLRERESKPPRDYLGMLKGCWGGTASRPSFLDCGGISESFSSLVAEILSVTDLLAISSIAIGARRATFLSSNDYRMINGCYQQQQ